LAWPRPRRALTAAAVVTLAATAISHLDRVLPAAEPYIGTAVGAVFLAAAWFLVLRQDTQAVRAYGLSLGGLTEPEPLEPRRLLASALRAVGWALLVAAVVFPPFWLGYRLYWQVDVPFTPRLPADFWDHVLGQLLVIALPEEAFYRGYLQPALDGAWKKKQRRVLGASLGPGWILSCAIFAAGHVLADPRPQRLAVFFPALLFGWLRARTGGIGAAVVFHALCNLLSSALERGYTP